MLAAFKSISELHHDMIYQKQTLHEKYGVQDELLLLEVASDNDKETIMRLNKELGYLKEFNEYI